MSRWHKTRQGHGQSPGANRAFRHGHLQPLRASGSAQETSDSLLASDWRGDFHGSECSGTQSTHYTSLFSPVEDEATQYSGHLSDDTSFAPALSSGFTQLHPGTAFDEELLLGIHGPTDAGEPLAGQVADDATVEPLSLSSMGGHFSDASYMGGIPQLFHGPAAHLVLAVPPGAEDLLQQLRLSEQPDPSEQPVPSQWPDISNAERTFAKDAIRKPPWNPHQHQSTYLQPPLPGYLPGAYPLGSGTPAPTISSFSSAPSSQESQRGGSQAPTRCDECGTTFNSDKALQRHWSSTAAHQDEDDGVYICKCGSTTSRKDNFKRRHFAKCPKLHHPSDVFTCICCYQNASVSSMEQHFAVCPRQSRRGRPPSRTAPSPRRYISFS